MALVQEFLEQFLIGDASLTALLGQDDKGPAIYPEGGTPEDAAYPRITYQVIDTPNCYTLSGPTGFVYPRVQLDIRAKGATGVKDAWMIAEAVRKSQGGLGGPKLDGYHGVAFGVDVRWVKLIDRSEEWEPPIHAEEFPVRRVRMDLLIYLIES